MSGSQSPSAGASASSKSRVAMSTEQKAILVVLLVPLFMSLLSVSIVNVVLPSIEVSLGASASALQWILAGYTLAFGVLLVPAGRAGDVFGRGKLFMAGVGLFGAASLLAGFAPNDAVLNLARILMGFGSGLLNPQTVGMIQQYYDGELRGRAFGLFGLVVGLSVAVGPVLGGLFVEILGTDWGWRASFLVNVPMALLGIAATLKFLPTSAWQPLPEALMPTTSTGAIPAVNDDASGSQDTAEASTRSAASSSRPAGASSRPAGARPRVDLDPVGVLMLGAATLLIILPFLQGTMTPILWVLLPVGLVVLALWTLWEKRYKRVGKSPMVDMELFRDSSFSTSALVISIYFAGMPAIWVVIALYLQNGLGFTALQAGLVGLPSAILSAFSSALAGRLTWKMGRSLVLWGLITLQVGLVMLLFFIYLVENAGASPWLAALALAIVGLGGGAIVSPNQTFALMNVPLAYAGAAGGILQTGQRIGTAIGISAITGIYFIALGMGGHGLAALVAFGAVSIVVGISGTLTVWDVKRERSGHHPHPAHKR